MPMIAITTRSSTSVKAERLPLAEARDLRGMLISRSESGERRVAYSLDTFIRISGELTTKIFPRSVKLTKPSCLAKLSTEIEADTAAFNG